MAETLERFIGPGERIAYRASQGHEPCTWTIEFSVVIIVLVPAVIVGLSIFGPDGLAVSATAAACLALSAPFWARRVASADVAVTNRRVLRLDTAKSELDYKTVALADISRVEILRGAVEITKRNGEAVVLKHPRDARQIAETLSRAAGVAAPSTPRREVRIAGGILYSLVWFGMPFIGIPVIRALKAEPVLANGLADTVFRIVLTAGALGAWWLLIGLLGVIVISRFLTWDETSRLVLRSNLFFHSSPQATKADWLTRFILPHVLRIIDWLYGGSTLPQSDGHGHG